MTKETVTPIQAAKLLGYSNRVMINRLIKNGTLSAKMCECGHSHLLNKDEVLALAKQRKTKMQNKIDSMS